MIISQKIKLTFCDKVEFAIAYITIGMKPSMHTDITCSKLAFTFVGESITTTSSLNIWCLSLISKIAVSNAGSSVFLPYKNKFYFLRKIIWLQNNHNWSN